MLSIDEKLQKMVDLSGQIMRLGRNTLLVNLRFMDAALSRLTPVAVYEGIIVSGEEAEVGALVSRCTLATDGQFLAYSPVFVLNGYRAERQRPARDILHSVMHCVFRHMYIHSLLERRCWDLACDIAVENAIAELGVPAVFCARQDKQRFVINGLKNDVGMLTAEKLYRYYLDKKLSDRRMTELEELFRADEHDLWYLPPETKTTVSVTLRQNAAQQQENEDGQNGNDQNGENKKDGRQGEAQNGGQQGENAEDGQQGGEQDSQNAGGRNDGNDGRGMSAGMTAAEAEQDWQNVSERMQTDIIMFSNGRYGGDGSLVQNLKEVNREKYDYAEFLKKFAVMGEVMKINDDEFDYIFYTYGLKLYENMPLIEPLEYKETKRIKDFVIAIDTSGSVHGDLVQTFVKKTYNVLKSTESFFSRINLHIIQCDHKIQEDVKITSQEEFDEYLKHMTLKGFGGNNEVLLFQYVEDLIRQKQFTNLKGMIYFTDGYGIFPKDKPSYDVAFVFINDRYEIPEVPPWVIRLVLQKEDI